MPQVLARIVGMADAAQEPSHFPTSPALAVPRALAHAGLGAAEVDFYEINEAFSVVDIANRQLLNLNDDRCGGSPTLTLFGPSMTQSNLRYRQCRAPFVLATRPMNDRFSALEFQHLASACRHALTH